MKLWRFWLGLLVVVVSIVNCGCVYVWIDSEEELVKLDKMMSLVDGQEGEGDSLEVVRFDLDYYRQLYGNSEIVGRVVLENSGLDTLFVQTGDNDFYLSHGLDKSDSILGSVFMDYRVSFGDRKILLYGHNANYYDTAFKVLENFMDNDYYWDHKYVDVSLDNYFYRYEIFSVALVKDDYDYFKVVVDDYVSHIMKLKEMSLYDTLVEVDGSEDILILQTCSNVYKDTFIVISAKKIWSYEY